MIGTAYLAATRHLLVARDVQPGKSFIRFKLLSKLDGLVSPGSCARACRACGVALTRLKPEVWT